MWTPVALACFLLTFVAEAVAFVLLVKEARRAQDALKRFAEANPHNHEGLTYAQQKLLGPMTREILGNSALRTRAITLIAVGIVASLVGNIASLDGLSSWL